MASTENVKDFGAKVQEQFKDAQVRAKGLEAEARKAFQSLSEKAQVELKGWLTQAQATSRDSLSALGGELVKLGKRLQELARTEKKAAAEEVKPAEVKEEPPVH